MPSQKPSVADDLYILGDPSTSEDLTEDINTVEEMAFWNNWYRENGHKDATTDEYGDLNGLASDLGIKVTSNPEVFPGSFS